MLKSQRRQSQPALAQTYQAQAQALALGFTPLTSLNHGASEVLTGKPAGTQVAGAGAGIAAAA